MKKITNTLRVVVFIVTIAPYICFAYSGAGGECGNSALESAAKNGTPDELAIAIDQKVDSLEKVVAAWSAEIAWHPNYQDTSRVWLNKKGKSATREEKRRIFAQWSTGCQEIKLLDVAVSTANAKNVEFLISLGSDPNAPSYRGRTLLMRCPYATNEYVVPHGVPPARTQEQQGRVLAVYTFLLNHGMSIEQQDKEGLNALHLCKDPEIIKFLIKAGANVLIGIDRKLDPSTIRDFPVTKRVVDYRARAIVDSLNWEVDAQFAIIEQFIPLVIDRRVTAETERLISWRCEEPRKASICSRLGGLISVRDSNIFKPLKDRNSQASSP